MTASFIVDLSTALFAGGGPKGHLAGVCTDVFTRVG
jgi:hypothetical protein